MQYEASPLGGTFLERGETCGNRFALLDCRATGAPALDAVQALAAAVCDPHVAREGRTPPADDLLVVVASDDGAPGIGGGAELGADARLVVIGADGRVADLCGNGLLYAAAALAAESGATGVVVESVRGLHRAHADGDLWSAVLETPRRLPGEAEHLRRALGLRPGGVRALDSGEPHVVIDADCLGVGHPLRPIGAEVAARIAAAVADSPVPGGVNVDLASAEDDGSIAIRTWERGVRRFTESCGTGAAAAAWALSKDALRRGRTVLVRATGGEHRVRLDGGRLRITATPVRGTRRDVAAMVEDGGVPPALREALAQVLFAPRLPAEPPAGSAA